ncbi:MAG: dihydrodipicolinate synthase family protein [Treponema sp.]|nr:dihydrodipicolinate synthase family protein [Treponema sp.]
MIKKMRGIYAIPCTPMNDDYSLDEDGLVSIINFIAASGAHGIVAPVNASEFTTLTDDERKRIVEICSKANKGRLPYVAGVSGTYTAPAVMFARQAEDAGADAVIAMPPYLQKASESEIFRYYEAISRAIKIPIFIQNYIPPVGTPLSASFMARLINEIENVRLVKEETQYAGHVITELVKLLKNSPRFEGVMGGKAGRYIIDEYHRGCSGNMPACEICDIQAKIWNALESGDEAKAVKIYNQIISLLNMESLYGSTLYKEVLRRRGIIKSATVRSLGNKTLDDFDHKELDRIMGEIKPLFAI